MENRRKFEASSMRVCIYLGWNKGRSSGREENGDGRSPEAGTDWSMAGRKRQESQVAACGGARNRKPGKWWVPALGAEMYPVPVLRYPTGREQRFPGLLMGNGNRSGSSNHSSRRTPSRRKMCFSHVEIPKVSMLSFRSSQPAGGWATEGSAVPKCSRVNPAPIRRNMNV